MVFMWRKAQGLARTVQGGIRIRTARSCTLARRDDGEGPDPETKVQVKFQNLSWEQALYNDCLDFSDVVEDVRSDIYHEKLDGHFLVGYVFSDPRIGETVHLSELPHPETASSRRAGPVPGDTGSSGHGDLPNREAGNSPDSPGR